MKRAFHHLIFVGMVAGVVAGVALGMVDPASAARETTLWWLDLIGQTLFVGALKMIIAPLILASIVAGVTSLANVGDLGRIGWRVFFYYFATTTLAVVIGLTLVLTIQPGRKAGSVRLREARATELLSRRAQFQMATGDDPLAASHRGAYLAWLHAQEDSAQSGGGEARRWQSVTRAEGRKPRDMLRDDILATLLSNPFEALARRESLGIIFSALLLGIACIVVGPPARPVVDFFQAANVIILRITAWIMMASPVAVACLLAALVARQGLQVFESLGWYCATVIGGIAVHVTLLVFIAWRFGGITPRALLSGVREAWLVAFSTRSSAATLPVTMRCVIEKLRIRPQVADFALPIGATINMDGTALYEGVAVLYLLQIYAGLDDVSIVIGGAVTLLVFITAVLASVGAAAVPDAGLVTMVLVATAVHLPVYYIPLIFGVDAFLDMFRTSTNVLGDIVGCAVVDRLEGDRLSSAS